MPGAIEIGCGGRKSRQRGCTIVKPDPDAPNVSETAGGVRTEHSDESSEYDTSTRNPPPSERITEPDPLMTEVRVRHNGAAAAASPTSVPNAEESFFHTSFQDIGKKFKECNDTLGELQQLGVSHDVQLPELVLVGDQSAGKSSLMSGLANLDPPRSEGTCTRCPLHIRVSRHTEWSCRVWLRKEYSYKPPPDRTINESDVTNQDPFFPWRKLPSTAVHEFKTMHDKSEIEDVLRWAQIAILNDDKHHGLFVPGSGSIATSTPIAKAAEETVAKFSPNIVALEIKGPGLPDLSFYDMPGIFQNPADARDDYLVNVVRNLSSAYMSHASAIIICSMPMNSDAENSATFGLTRRLGASSRTIGVLTKADLLPKGGISNYDQWLTIMKGETHQTGLGYFITSRPQGKDLEELKKWEEHVFEDHSFDDWPEDFHQFSDRCGIEKLKAFLSERLGEEFAKSLPNIKHTVELHLDKITKQLGNLPELPENVELEIQTGLMTFADIARAKMDEFMRHFNVLPRNFRDCLLEIKPKFTLKDRTDHPTIDISDDESDNLSIASTPTAKRHAPVSHATPSKRLRFDGAITTAPNGQIKPEEVNGGPSVRASGGSRPPPPAAKKTMLPEPFTNFATIGRGFRTLREVREEMQAKTKAGMPDRISDEVYVDLVKEAIKPWNRPMDAFIKQTMKDLQSELDATLGKALDGLKKRFIYPEAKRHVRKCLEEHRKETEAALIGLYNDEMERLLTFNEESFKQYRDDEHIVLTRFRHNMRMEAAGLAVRPLGQWNDMPEEKRVQDSKRREAELVKLGPDQFVRELEVVAYVRGYYRLAALRFADAVSQRILCRMIPAIRRKLPAYLEEKLGLRSPNAHGVYEKLMEEDLQTATKREMLKLEKLKFDKALASIELLETGASRVLDGVEGDEQSTQPVSRTAVEVDTHMVEEV
ncbi:Interferon-induced GTP-binding protein Mx [Tolypocladium ophioglossoides CBS 100239]|uniref:Interferon-induced GTP-binding protein Mx n=1 Tax=Tolypocladium ophioglossoides (strain CBS 100239) TaxID=1163406 RepID=A0A0L0NFS4_TOLOC|nr:Interferon-induced GTP-binding protein Mx [Tolypocladium ophioglossoides CBS 100239]